MSAEAPVRSAKPSKKLRSSGTLTVDLPSIGDEARDGFADRDRDGISAPKIRESCLNRLEGQPDRAQHAATTYYLIVLASPRQRS